MAILISSTIQPLGVAFANIVKGVPIERASNGSLEYVGGFFNLLNPYALLGGVVTLTVFNHGAVFLALKTTGNIRDKAQSPLTSWSELLP